MLLHLRVKNFLLIEELQLDFAAGLNIITGETGAGKSIILECISALTNSRLSKDFIRSNCTQAYLEGTFSRNSLVEDWLTEQELELEEPELILSRELSAKGSKARLNGQLVSSRLVQQLGDLLFEAHHQDAREEFLEAQWQLAYLDNYLDKEHQQRLTNYCADWAHWQRLHRSKEQKLVRARDAAKQLDYLRFQHAELADLKLENPQEEELLRVEIARLANQSAVQDAIDSLYEAYFEAEGNIAAALQTELKALNKASKHDSELQTYHQQLQELEHSFAETVRELKRFAERDIEDNPLEILDRWNARISALQKARHKHQTSTLAELIALREQWAQEIRELENFSTDLEQLEEDIAQAEKNLYSLARALSEARQSAAQFLSDSLTKQLPSLGLKGALFQVECKAQEELRESGVDQISFLLASNPGAEPRPLGKVASGGERSRIALLLKSLTSMGKPEQTLLFDEIDTGTSGAVAEMIGHKLSEIGHQQQLICVTHQPLVACFAHQHYLVQKAQDRQQTTLRVKPLSERPERVQALLELLAGQQDRQLALDYACQLLEQAQAQTSPKSS